MQKAQLFYSEALQHDAAHEGAMLALARLHLAANDLDTCEKQCETLLRVSPGNREASMMIADLMFRKDQHQEATYHFQRLLQESAAQFGALEKLLALLRRA